MTSARTWPASPGLTDDPKDFGPDGYQYGFIADNSGFVVAYAYFSLPFTTYEMAEHTGSKSYWETLTIVRRKPFGEWEEAPRG